MQHRDSKLLIGLLFFFSQKLPSLDDTAFRDATNRRPEPSIKQLKHELNFLKKKNLKRKKNFQPIKKRYSYVHIHAQDIATENYVYMYNVYICLLSCIVIAAVGQQNFLYLWP